MYSSTPKLGFGILLAALAAGLLISTWLPATTTTTTAERILGQTGFGSNAASGGAAGLSGAISIALDHSGSPAHLYVADTANNRVLGYRDASAFSNGQAADLVIGQQNFCSTACNAGGKAGAATLCSPSGVTLDGDGNLYVADSGNNRVTEYDAPFSAFSANQQSAGFIAAHVIGQFDFTSAGCNQSNSGSGSPTAATLCGPRAVAFDGDQRLYVADAGNSRVLGYDSPLDRPVAGIVIGQLDFLSSRCNMGGAPSALSLCIPSGVAADKSGNLYVGDQNNNRVLEFDAPRSSGLPAHLVFGQSGLTSGAAGGCAGGIASADELCLPQGVALDDSQSLYVADSGNSRVLEYLNPLAPGAGTQGTSGSAGDTTADLVFGQHGDLAGTARNNGGTNADSLSAPAGVAVDETGSVYVADTGNNRVLEYNGASVPVSAITPFATPTATPEPSPCPGTAGGSEQSSQTQSNQPAPVAQARSRILGEQRQETRLRKVGLLCNDWWWDRHQEAQDHEQDRNRDKLHARYRCLQYGRERLHADGRNLRRNATGAQVVPIHGGVFAHCAGQAHGDPRRRGLCNFVPGPGQPDGRQLRRRAQILDEVAVLRHAANGGTPTKKHMKNVKVTSTFKVPSTISSVGVFTDKTGATASSEYTVDTTGCGTMTVVKGTSCVLAVTFDPFVGTGKDPAVLIVTDDAAKSPQIVKLSGKATGPTMSPPVTATPTPAATCTSAADCDPNSTCTAEPARVRIPRPPTAAPWAVADARSAHAPDARTPTPISTIAVRAVTFARPERHAWAARARREWPAPLTAAAPMRVPLASAGSARVPRTGRPTV